MRNRAKCKLCNDVIESFHATDYVLCKCEEIFVDGGEAMKCGANDFNNFVRLDEENNEVKVKVTDNEIESVINKKRSLDDMIQTYENLPEHALMSNANNYDILSILYLVKSLLSD